jgi:hypothetical protein
MTAGTEQILFPDEYGVDSIAEGRPQTFSVFEQLKLRLKSDEELMDALLRRPSWLCLQL